MAADLHIHILDNGATEQDYKDFNHSTMGSKYFGGLIFSIPLPKGRWEQCYEIFSKTSNIWIGSVSWLKAGLTDNSDEYIPDIVQKIYIIIGEDFPIIDDKLIQRISRACNKCINKTAYRIEEKDKIINFLKEHKGEKACTVSW